MVISVLERRSEIGLRRALGATRRQIRMQFLAEAIALAVAGGAAGVAAGAAATAIYARGKGWAVVIPAGLGRRPGRRRRHRSDRRPPPSGQGRPPGTH
jgi:ABC-type antimicrobial peptide transport system permease subunit